MTHVWYNMYFPKSGFNKPAAEIGIPPEGAFLWDTFVEGPDFPDVVWGRDDSSYAIRKDLDPELTDEELEYRNAQWDEIRMCVKHGHI